MILLITRNVFGCENSHYFFILDNDLCFQVKDALDSVGLADQSRVQSSKLSGGQKRKLSVAIAIIGDPKV